MTRAALGALFGLALALGAATAARAVETAEDAGDGLEPQFRGYSVADIEPVFELTDHTGATVTERLLHGEWAVVMFGYTRCTDACPWMLGAVANAVAKFDDSTPIRPVFVDFDATPDALGPLAALVDAMHPRMIGLAGTRRQLHLTGMRWKMRRMQRSPRAGEVGAQWHHTTRLYLLNPQGQVAMLIDGTATADQIAGAMAIAQAKAEGRYP